ncbi:MAG: penicillin-binding protein [Saprospiraceae bacterium]|nr:penicillin-binding protein [Saprospiraceae bacterium]
MLKVSQKFSSMPWVTKLQQWILQQSAIKLVLLGGGIFVLLCLTSVASMVLLVRSGAFGALPPYAELANIQNDQASEIYDHRGVLLGKYYVENRVNADSSELPQHLVQALIATEDARFFEHEGIDVRSLGRVLIKSILLSDESAGGGSTISQQLAKNLYPRKSYRYASIVINKLREMIIAHRMEQIYPKDRILRLYLNTVPFGGNAFGVKIAAQRYFSKKLKDLTIEEGAVLVGMLKATTYYNPKFHPERAQQRRNVVLKQMAKLGYLDEASATQLSATPMQLQYRPESHNLGLATYFREHIRQEVEAILAERVNSDGSPYQLYRDGLRIFTTLDAGLQRYAEAAVRTHLSELQQDFLKEWQGREPWATQALLQEAMQKSRRYQALKNDGKSAEEIEVIMSEPIAMTIFDWQHGEKEVTMSPLDSIRYFMQLLQTGMLVTEPQTGLVRAWVGGIDYKFIQYDHVKSRRQIGSTMKPLVYTAALRRGIEPCDYTENRLVKYANYKNWQPQNSDRNYGGHYSMAGALSHSVNTVAVDLALSAGIPSIRQLARDMGIEGNIPDEPSIALGTVEASLAELVQAYGTYANQGVKSPLHYLDRIEDQHGKVIYQSPSASSGQRVLTREEAAVMTQLMTAVVDSGSARRLRYRYGLWGPIAGKTGTTQHQSDGWFVGYTPSLVAGVWVGAELPSVHFRSIRTGQGANSALPIWGLFMKKVKDNKRTARYLSGAFDLPIDSVMAAMDCPHFLPEMPELYDSLNDLSDLLEFTQSVEGIESEQLGELMRDRPRKETETLSEYSQNIRARNTKVIEKRERKKKRKEFWGKLLGNKNK